jgi:hypothetical protein
VDNFFAVAEQFMPPGKVIDIREFGSGNINNTFLVTLDDTGERHFVLQRINTQVFRRPELVMQNMRIATEHIQQRLEQLAGREGRRWEVPRVILAHDGRDHWLAPTGLSGARSPLLKALSPLTRLKAAITR